MVEEMEIQKGYKKTEVGVMPNDWKLLPVSKFGEVKRGAGSQYIKYVNYNGIRFIRINDFFEDSPVYVSPTVDIMRFAITESDVLFAGTGASAGASYIPKKEWIGLPHSYNAPRIRTNENHSKEFLLHTLQSEYIAKQQRAWFVGAAQPFLDLNAISNFLIATPPTKAEQTAIATALNDADALITQLEKLIAKKRSIKQGAMQELLKPKEGWEVKKLGEECDLITKGTTPTSVGRDFQKSGINFIKIESLTENGKIIKDKVAYIDIYTHNLFKRSQLKSSDVLFSIAGALGRVAIVNDEILPANTNQALAIIRLKKETEIDLKHLFYFLNSNKIQTLILATNVQGAQANLSLQNISDLPVEYPSKLEQTHIAQILSDMDAEIEVLEKKLDKYKMLKQGMMQTLLTGRIRLV